MKNTVIDSEHKRIFIWLRITTFQNLQGGTIF